MKRKGYDLYNVVDLIVRRLLGGLDEKEKEEYERMMNESGLLKHTEEITVLPRLAMQPEPEGEKRRVRAYLKFRHNTQKRNLSILKSGLRVASVVLFLFAAGGGVYWFSRQAAVTSPYTQEIVPAQSRAYLYLADGSCVDLSQGAENVRIFKNNITVCDSGLLKYGGSEEKGGEDAAYNKICVPRGGEYRLILSDGTGVWINAGTELKYPVLFGEGIREVYVNGEAYFEVKKDTSRPFVVHTSRGAVKVLGTEFNVRDYIDEQRVVTTLVKGKVEYRTDHSHVVLNPGFQSIDINNKISVQRVNVEEYVGWKDGKYTFFDESLENLMRYVERTYDATVFFTNDAIRSLRFSGDLQRYDRVELFLRYLESAGDVRFDIQHKTITVYKK